MAKAQLVIALFVVVIIKWIKSLQMHPWSVYGRLIVKTVMFVVLCVKAGVTYHAVHQALAVGQVTHGMITTLQADMKWYEGLMTLVGVFILRSIRSKWRGWVAGLLFTGMVLLQIDLHAIFRGTISDTPQMVGDVLFSAFDMGVVLYLLFVIYVIQYTAQRRRVLR